jgi:hypothetical protein
MKILLTILFFATSAQAGVPFWQAPQASTTTPYGTAYMSGNFRVYDSTRTAAASPSVQLGRTGYINATSSITAGAGFYGDVTAGTINVSSISVTASAGIGAMVQVSTAVPAVDTTYAYYGLYSVNGAAKNNTPAGTSRRATGVYGEGFGVASESGASAISVGVSGKATGYGTNYGLYGYAANGAPNYAAYLDGDMLSTGVVSAASFSGSGTSLTGVVKTAGDTMMGQLTVLSSITISGISKSSQVIAAGGIPDSDVYGPTSTYPLLVIQESNVNNSSIVGYDNTAAGVVFNFMKTRSTSSSADANTILNNGDYIGRLAFRGSDGVAYRAAAGISSVVDGAPGSSDMPGALVFETTPDGSITRTERMRIDNAGQVRIGPATATIYAPLQVSNATPVLRMEDTDISGSAIQINGINGHLGLQADPGNAVAASSITFALDGTIRNVMLSSGYFGAGTPFPGAPLTSYRTPSNTAGDVAQSFAYANSSAGNDLWGFRLSASSYDFNIDRNYGGWSTPGLTINRQYGYVAIGPATALGPLDVSAPYAGGNSFAYLGGSTGERTVRIGDTSGGYASIQGYLRGTGARDLTLQPEKLHVGIYDETPDANLEILATPDDSPSSYLLAVSSQNDTTGNIFSVLADGKVGVGTANPNTKLHISTGEIKLDGDGIAPGWMNGSGRGVYATNRSGNTLSSGTVLTYDLGGFAISFTTAPANATTPIGTLYDTSCTAGSVCRVCTEGICPAKLVTDEGCTVAADLYVIVGDQDGRAQCVTSPDATTHNREIGQPASFTSGVGATISMWAHRN